MGNSVRISVPSLELMLVPPLFPWMRGSCWLLSCWGPDRSSQQESQGSLPPVLFGEGVFWNLLRAAWGCVPPVCGDAVAGGCDRELWASLLQLIEQCLQVGSRVNRRHGGHRCHEGICLQALHTQLWGSDWRRLQFLFEILAEVTGGGAEAPRVLRF